MLILTESQSILTGKQKQVSNCQAKLTAKISVLHGAPSLRQEVSLFQTKLNCKSKHSLSNNNISRSYFLRSLHPCRGLFYFFFGRHFPSSALVYSCHFAPLKHAAVSAGHCHLLSFPKVPLRKAAASPVGGSKFTALLFNKNRLYLSRDIGCVNLPNSSC